MKKVNRKFMIVGNWKMNPDTLEEAKAIFSKISRAKTKYSKVNVVIATPSAFVSDLAGKKIPISAEDVSRETRGAFTGSVSARQIKSAGAEYTIIGHSERRTAGDTEEIVLAKVNSALEAGLRVILCIGEKERDQNAQYLHQIREQVINIFSKIDKKKVQWVTIAYEPIWAVGKSYDTAMKPSDIHEMTIYIKKTAAEVLGKNIGLKIPVLYGGSINADNAMEILRDGSIDGLLVGRQSLDSEAFSKIISYGNQLS